MKVRIYDPKTGRQLGFNTDQIPSWKTGNLVNLSGERVEGFCIHLFTADGRETIIQHDQGGVELLDALMTDFMPLNAPPTELP